MWWLTIVVVIGLVYLKQRDSMKVTVGDKELVENDSDGNINTIHLMEEADSFNERKELSFEEKKRRKELSARNNYTKRMSFWGSDDEKSTYYLIKDINRDTLIVLPHVSLNEIFETKPDKKYGDQREKYIKYYHVDFLICEKEHLTPLLGIEVDGKYHNNTSQQLSDAFKDELFKNNNIPLLRIDYNSYNSKRVVDEIKNILCKAPIYCGNCGAEMVLRNGVEGKDNFYGCSCYKLNKCTYKRQKDFKYVS